MKKFTFLIIAFVSCFQFNFIAQSCLPEGIEFITQSQIDNFPSNHPNCSEIEGFVHIFGADIENLDSLSSLTKIGGYLSIGYQSQGNPKLNDITGLANIDTIGGGLMINSNETLENLNGLNNVKSLGIDLHITYNPLLSSLEKLSNLTTIPEGIYLFSNGSLTSLHGLHNVTSIGYDVYIQMNHMLTDFSGLEKLTNISGNVSISYNNSLGNFSGLDNLTAIIGSLIIENNQSLLNFNGLGSLTILEGGIRIVSNEVLETLSGIDNVNADNLTGMTIRNNDSLTNCEVKSICDYLAIPDGIVTIQNNANGCDSEEEVEAACLVSITQIDFSDQILIYPNPFSSSTTIEYQLDEQQNVDVFIFNHLGKLIEHFQTLQTAGKQSLIWDASALPAGMYFFTIRSGNKFGKGKMVLLD